MNSPSEACPCGSNSEFETCCSLYHHGTWAPNPEALMRSRYSAYVTGNIPYLLDTVHPDKRADLDPEHIRTWSQSSIWNGLEIRKCVGGTEADPVGTVEFVAHYTKEGQRREHHELSEFRKHEHRWYFYEGTVPKSEPVKRTTPKAGRNDPCPCGSGRKYKKCCMR